MDEITAEINRIVDYLSKPPRLVIGSHPPASGIGCVMNVLSWEDRILNPHAEWTGDTPSDVKRELRSMIIQANDSCRHGSFYRHPAGYGFPRTVRSVCSDCARRLFILAHKVRGSAYVEDGGLAMVLAKHMPDYSGWDINDAEDLYGKTPNIWLDRNEKLINRWLKKTGYVAPQVNSQVIAQALEHIS